MMMFRVKTKFIIIFITLLKLCNGARILAYVPTPSFSHQVVFRPLWRELSLRGHDLTVVTTNPMNDPKINLTEIDIQFSYGIMNENIMKIINSSPNAFNTMLLFVDMFFEILDEQMKHSSIQKLIHDPNKKFDVVIVEHLMAPQVAFAKHFGCPLIGIASLPVVETTNTLLGVPTHPVLFPDVLIHFDKAETLYQRITSVVYSLFMHILNSYFTKSYHDPAIERYFGTGFGSSYELMSNVSIFLTNANPILDRPRPMVPGVIQVGGLHRTLPKPLPKELKSLLDSATEGFIYFSLGSNVKSKDIPLKTRQVFLETFAELPYKVLWKFELDDLPNKPDNVHISKWFPQTDILKHSNIILFITQGGLQSMEEAIYEGVPMIGIPYFGDQPGNVQKMVRKGMGLSIDFATIEKNHFKTTIMEVISNSKYRNKVKEISRLALDQPMTALDQAVWWIEYVIRHKGATHLRSPLIDIPWYQYLLLDVIFCLVLIIVLLLIVTKAAFKFVITIAKKLIGVIRKRKQD